jgi:hypothetical protein
MIELEVAVTKRGRVQTYKRTLPSGWDDIQSENSALYCLRQLSFRPLNQAQLACGIYFLDLPVSLRNLLSTTQHADIIQAMSWMNLESGPRPLITSFRHKGQTYHLPATKFANGAAKEYPIADDYYTRFLEGDVKCLDHLVGTLARPENRDAETSAKLGDKRQPLLSRADAEKRGEQLTNIPLEVKMAVLMYFAGAKKYVNETYGEWLFQAPDQPDDEQEDDDVEIYKQEASRGGVMFGWWGIFMDVAESGVFGNLDQVHQTNFHSICMYLVKKKNEEKELQRQTPSPAGKES